MSDNPPMSVELQRRINTTVRKRHRHKTWAGRDIKYSEELRSWMLGYADWLFSASELPTLTERRNQLGFLSKKPVSTKHVKMLEARPDFQAYMEALQAGPMAEARARYQARLPKYVDIYDTSVDKLVEAGEFKAAADAVQSAIDRVMPRKMEAVAASQIVIQLAPQQAAGLSTAYIPAEVDAEIVKRDEPDSI